MAFFHKEDSYINLKNSLFVLILRVKGWYFTIRFLGRGSLGVITPSISPLFPYTGGSPLHGSSSAANMGGWSGRY